MEKMDKLSNYFFVTYEKEKSDTEKLIKKIIDSGWIKPETILVNCSPDYSSNLTQVINHKLSFISLCQISQFEFKKKY